MSTHIDDLRSSVSMAAGVYPTTISMSAQGPTVDLAAGDSSCFAIQEVGDAPGDGTLDGRIEQSSNGSSWAAISGAAFAQLVAGNDIQVIRFQRTAKYVRWAATVAGSSPAFTVSVLIGSQKKTF